MKLAITVLALGFVTVALPQAKAPRHAATTAEAAIRGVLEAQVGAWNRGDLVAYMHGYWRSPDLTFVGADGQVRGWHTLLERYRRVYSSGNAMGRLSFNHLRVTVLAPGVALSDADFHLRRDGREESGVFTLVWRRLAEGWRIIHEHTTLFAHASLK